MSGPRPPQAGGAPWRGADRPLRRGTLVAALVVAVVLLVGSVAATAVYLHTAPDRGWAALVGGDSPLVGRPGEPQWHEPWRDDDGAAPWPDGGGRTGPWQDGGRPAPGPDDDGGRSAPGPRPAPTVDG